MKATLKRDESTVCGLPSKAAHTIKIFAASMLILATIAQALFLNAEERHFDDAHTQTQSVTDVLKQQQSAQHGSILDRKARREFLAPVQPLVTVARPLPTATRGVQQAILSGRQR